MATEYQVIDRRKWKRNMHCHVFENSLEPQYCISLELDITNFLKMVKKNNYPFTFAFIYVVCKCANEIEEFRYRFLVAEGVILIRKRIYAGGYGDIYKRGFAKSQKSKRIFCCSSSK